MLVPTCIAAYIDLMGLDAMSPEMYVYYAFRYADDHFPPNAVWQKCSTIAPGNRAEFSWFALSILKNEQRSLWEGLLLAAVDLYEQEEDDDLGAILLSSLRERHSH